MDQEIEFTFLGKRYKVSGLVSDQQKIVLPDGRVLEIGCWLVSEEEPHNFFIFRPVPVLITGNSSLDEIASQVNGVVAELISPLKPESDLLI